MLKKIFDFFIFTSLFIAACAVLMVCQAGLLFSLHIEKALYVFVFSGSVCSYNFHWYLTPPSVAPASYKLRWNVSNRQLHLLLSVAGLAGAAVSSALLINHWLWLGVTAFLTFLYSAPKIQHPFFIQLQKIAVGKTIFLAAAWAHITGLLPLVIEIKSLQPVHLIYVLNRFLFLYAICIVFDRRDVEQDKQAGIKSLITFLSPKGVDGLFWCTLALSAISCLSLVYWLSWLSVAILLLPVVILFFLYEPSKKNISDYLYYFVLDGLMALSAPILILAKFAT